MRQRWTSAAAGTLVLVVLAGACSSGSGETPPTAAPDDRGMYAAASSIRICAAATDGIGAAAQDIGAAANEDDVDRVHALATALSAQAQQLAANSKSGAGSLQEHAASEDASGTKDEGLTLFGACEDLGNQAAAFATTASAADADSLESVTTAAQDVADSAEQVGTDATTYADGLPKP